MPLCLESASEPFTVESIQDASHFKIAMDGHQHACSVDDYVVCLVCRGPDRICQGEQNGISRLIPVDR